MPIQSAVEGRTSTYYPNTTNLPEKSKLSKITPIVGGAVGGGILATAGVMAYMHHAAIAGAFTTAGKAIIGVGATALGTIGGGAGAALIGALNTFKTFNTRHNSQLTAIHNLNFNDIFEKDGNGPRLKLKEGINPHQHLYNKYGSMFKSIGGTNYNKLLESINKNIEKELQKNAAPTDAVHKAIHNTLDSELCVSQFRKAGTAMAMYIAAGALIGSAVGGSLGAGFGAAPTALLGAACGLGLGIIGAIATFAVSKAESNNISAKAKDFAGSLELDTVVMSALDDRSAAQTAPITQTESAQDQSSSREPEEPETERRRPEPIVSEFNESDHDTSLNGARRNSVSADDGGRFEPDNREDAIAFLRSMAPAKKEETVVDDQPESQTQHNVYQRRGSLDQNFVMPLQDTLEQGPLSSNPIITVNRSSNGTIKAHQLENYSPVDLSPQLKVSTGSSENGNALSPANSLNSRSNTPTTPFDKRRSAFDVTQEVEGSRKPVGALREVDLQRGSSKRSSRGELGFIPDLKHRGSIGTINSTGTAIHVGNEEYSPQELEVKARRQINQAADPINFDALQDINLLFGSEELDQSQGQVKEGMPFEHFIKNEL